MFDTLPFYEQLAMARYIPMDWRSPKATSAWFYFTVKYPTITEPEPNWFAN